MSTLRLGCMLMSSSRSPPQIFFILVRVISTPSVLVFPPSFRVLSLRPAPCLHATVPCLTFLVPSHHFFMPSNYYFTPSYHPILRRRRDFSSRCRTIFSPRVRRPRSIFFHATATAPGHTVPPPRASVPLRHVCTLCPGEGCDHHNSPLIGDFFFSFLAFDSVERQLEHLLLLPRIV